MTEDTGLDPSSGGEREESVRSTTPKEVPFSALRPLMEGARARGVADLCELLGMAAVLIGGTGEVLHSTSRAGALLVGPLRLAGGHLVADQPTANSLIEQTITAALSGSSSERLIEICDRRLWLRAMPFPCPVDDGAQLLKAILFISQAEAGAGANDGSSPAQAA